MACPYVRCCSKSPPIFLTPAFAAKGQILATRQSQMSFRKTPFVRQSLRRTKLSHQNIRRAASRKPVSSKTLTQWRTALYLTKAEVEKLIKAARNGRYSHRDATLILIAFRHGLRGVSNGALRISS